jgi:hypothetical protein
MNLKLEPTESSRLRKIASPHRRRSLRLILRNISLIKKRGGKVQQQLALPP